MPSSISVYFCKSAAVNALRAFAYMVRRLSPFLTRKRGMPSLFLLLFRFAMRSFLRLFPSSLTSKRRLGNHYSCPVFSRTVQQSAELGGTLLHRGGVPNRHACFHPDTFQ